MLVEESPSRTLPRAGALDQPRGTGTRPFKQPQTPGASEIQTLREHVLYYSYMGYYHDACV